jgi:hypothetical protein
MLDAVISGSPASNVLNGTSSTASRCDHAHHFFSVSTPTADDDSVDGYDEGTLWIQVDDIDAPTAVSGTWLLLDATSGSAVWVQPTTSGSSGITILDEGVSLSTNVDTIDFVGSGVNATLSGTTVTVTISGTGGGGSYTDEQAQDAVGAMIADTATVNLTYTDATPELKADVIPGGIKLDDLGAPDDNTDLNASTSKHGLLPKLGGGTTNFLRADGTWAAPPSGGSLALDDLTDVDTTSSAPSDGDVLTYDNGSSLWVPAAPTGGGGGGGNAQVFDYPTSLSGDSNHFSALTGYSDVGTNAFGTLEILNSSILHMQTVGNKSSVLRHTLSTALTGAFDVRTLMMMGGTFFSANDQTTHTFALQRADGIGVMRVRFRSRVTGTESAYYMQVYYNNGSTADVHLPWVKAGEAVTLRLTRDASNNLGWYLGIGERPMAMIPLISASSRALITGTSSLQVDRIEYQIATTGQAAGHVADMFVDYLEII